jgi:hypothetical protein
MTRDIHSNGSFFRRLKEFLRDRKIPRSRSLSFIRRTSKQSLKEIFSFKEKSISSKERVTSKKNHEDFHKSETESRSIVELPQDRVPHTDCRNNTTQQQFKRRSERKSWRKSFSSLFSLQQLKPGLKDFEAEMWLSKLQPPITITSDEPISPKAKLLLSKRKSIRFAEAIANCCLVEQEFPPSEDEVQVITCISDRKFGLPLLIKFSHSEHNLENIEMWIDLENIMSKFHTWNDTTKLLYITQIYSKYISPTSLREVNVGAESKKAVENIVLGEWMQNKDTPRPELVIMHLKSQVMTNLLDTWSRFKATEHYTLYLSLINSEL